VASLAADGTITVTGTAPATAGSVSYYFTGTKTDDTAGTTKSATLPVVAKGSGGGEGGGSGSSSSGCDAGFAGLALLLAAPLFLRKKD
jgi:Synergist-CTERM protein sorting domain-containing protein